MVKFIRCNQCNASILGDTCQFATHKRVIDGEEYVFCCQKCAEKFKPRKTGTNHSNK